jgi:hypothetical protein
MKPAILNLLGAVEDANMPNDSFWTCVKALASSLDGDRDGSEQTLNHLEEDLKQFSPQNRADVQHEMTTIIAQLSRLQVRLMTED